MSGTETTQPVIYDDGIGGTICAEPDPTTGEQVAEWNPDGNDGGVSNSTRAEAADAAMSAYLEAKPTEEDESNLSDLLADLMHLCARDAGRFPDFNAAVATARMNFEIEACAEFKEDTGE